MARQVARRLVVTKEKKKRKKHRGRIKVELGANKINEASSKLPAKQGDAANLMAFKTTLRFALCASFVCFYVSSSPFSFMFTIFFLVHLF